MEEGYWSKKLREALLGKIEEEERPETTDKDTLRKHLSEAGRKGGSQPKIKGPIVFALAIFIHKKRNASDMTNNMIAKSFCKSHPENNLVVLPPDQNGVIWEIFSSGDLIFMRVHEVRGKAKKLLDKSITYTTLQNVYIPKAKCFLQEIIRE